MQFCTKCGSKCSEEDEFCSVCGSALKSHDVFTAAPEQYEEPVLSASRPKKKSKTALILILCAVVLLAALAAVFFFTNIFGNHRFNITSRVLYDDNELYSQIDMQYDKNGDMIKRVCTYYSDGVKMDRLIYKYEYSGKHELSGITNTFISYDENGEEVWRDTDDMSVVSEKNGDCWYCDMYYSDGDFYRTSVWDKSGFEIKELDEDGNVLWVDDMVYDFFGKPTSVTEIQYDEAGEIELQYELSYDYSGDECILSVVDASDWDDNTDYYENYEQHIKWETSYFW